MKKVMPDAAHPQQDRLPAYLLGELDAATQASIEAHLATCEACRATLARLDDAYVASIETLDAPAPPTSAWSAIAARTGHAGGTTTPAPSPPPRQVPRWLAAGWAATAIVAAVLGVWGVQQRATSIATADALATLEARVAVLEAVASTVQARADGLVTEQGRLVRWLARDDVATRRLPVADDGISRGAVLFLPDRRALVTLRVPPAEGETHAVWGVSDDGSSDLLASFVTRTVEVEAARYDALLVATVAEPAPTMPVPGTGRIEVPSE